MSRALLLMLLFLTAACAPAASPPVAPSPAGTASPTAPPRPVVRPDVVRIEMYEWSIDVDPPELPAGRYRVEVVNHGQRLHSVIVAGPGVDVESRRLRAGGAQSLEIEFQPGEYTLWCPVGDHHEYGMITYLTVLDASPR